MKKVALKISLFLLLFVSFYTAFYIGVNYLLNDSKNDKDAIYVWGDSQICQSLDVKTLTEGTGRKVYSAASHGNDVYNLCVFARKVPANSNVILGLSYGLYLRHNSIAFNESSICFKSLKDLKDNGYSFSDVLYIFKCNLRFNRLYEDRRADFISRDTADLRQLEELSQFFQKEPHYLDNKLNIILEAVRVLKNKGCHITLFNMPFHDHIQEAVNESPSIAKIMAFKQKMNEELQCNNLQLNVQVRGNYMYDVTHVNTTGMLAITNKVVSQIEELLNTNTYLCISLSGI